MYIEKRTIKDKTKYFLAHSFREGGKIHKLRKLLGTDLSKETLEERKKKLLHRFMDTLRMVSRFWLVEIRRLLI